MGLKTLPTTVNYYNDKEVHQPDEEVPQSDEEDPYAYVPPQFPQTEGEVKSAVENLTQKLRIQGMARRQQFNLSLKEFPDQWKSLRRPASMHSNQLSLAEMLTCVPPVDRDKFQESGDGHVNVPLLSWKTICCLRFVFEAICTTKPLKPSQEEPTL